MSKQQLSNLDFNNTSKITNLLNGTDDQDAATVGQLNAAVEGVSWKDSCRVATQSNINLASPGATIDSITMSANDRVLVMSQTSQPENGIYIWNGAAVAMSRSLDANTAAELEMAVVTIEEGTSAHVTYRQTSVNFTLGSGNIAWTTFGTSTAHATETTAGKAEIATQVETDTGTDDQRIVTPAKLANWVGRIRKYTTTIGDGSNTSFTVTHNLNTRDLTNVLVVRNSSPYDVVDVAMAATTANTVTVGVFSSAPSSNQFKVIVTG